MVNFFVRPAVLSAQHEVGSDFGCHLVPTETRNKIDVLAQ
jgi:hypothetical protein